MLALGCAAAPGPRKVTPAAPAPETPWSHGLIVDASSSASTLYAYRWRADEADVLPRIAAYDAPCPPVTPGLADFAGRPDEAAASLEPLLRCSLELVGPGPEARMRSSLHVLGTAGLRLLPAEQRMEILAAVRRLLATTPFGATSARVISGDEEGVYGWLGVNYMLGRLGREAATPTLGALDLGGASAQITFAPRAQPREHGRAITLAGDTYRLYTYSYLGLGQDEARAAVAEPACFLAGYPIPCGGVGTGDYAACREAIRATLARPCDREPCSLFGIYQPPVHGEFLALSAYLYTARFFDLADRLTPAAMQRAGAAFCSLSWQEVIAEDPSAARDPYLPNYCFSAAYVVTLLTEGFGLPFDTRLAHVPFEVRGAKVGFWALGALLYELVGSGD